MVGQRLQKYNAGIGKSPLQVVSVSILFERAETLRNTPVMNVQGNSVQAYAPDVQVLLIGIVHF